MVKDSPLERKPTEPVVSSGRKRAPATKAKAKPEPVKGEEAERRAKIEEKEARGRAPSQPHANRGPRPDLRPDPPSLSEDEERAKTADKEARNKVKVPVWHKGDRPEPVKVEPPREMTPEEIEAKERRGHIQRV
jgi:hypothetical protein